MPPPPLPEDHRDGDHIRLLVIFHYVYMGLQIAGLGFLAIHYYLMRSVMGLFGNVTRGLPKVVEETKVQGPPDSPPGSQTMVPDEVTTTHSVGLEAGESLPQFFNVFGWLYVAGAVLLILGITGNLISALKMAKRRSRVFSMLVAGFNCVSIPLGTVLGVFTLVVLGRRSVVNSYEAARQKR